MAKKKSNPTSYSSVSQPLVRVRLVPRSVTGASARTNAAFLNKRSARDFLPSPDMARATLAKIAPMSERASMSPQNNVTVLMEAGKVAEMFGAKLKRKASELSDTVVGTPKFLAPEGELQVPEDMAAEVDYAYIPEPPVFFNVNHVPPQASVYHLRVEDMARVVRAYSCHRQGWTGNGVKVVMADSGFAKHPFFEHYGFNITRVTTPTLSNPELDPSGHGTGESANCLVIAPDCTFVGVKHDDYSAEALETSIAQSPRIITNSWGWDIDTLSAAELQQSDPNMYNEFRDLDRIIKQAVADGICVVFSAGNGHRSFPGNHPDVISAGGVTVQANGALQASSYASSFVSKLFPGRQAPDFCGVVGSSGTSPQKGHIMLPVPNGCELEGENLTPALSNLGWGIFTGTSAAAPQIAGLAALILSANPSLKPADIKSILAATATDVTTGTTANGNTATVGNDLATGSGFVNAFRACLKAQQMIGP